MPNIPNKLSIFSRLFLWSLAAMLVAAGFASQARAQQLSQAEIDRRADALLARLTIEQKIKLIGGVDSMFTYEMPQIGLPRLKMSDGPVGVRVWGPSIAYAGGIGLAASWDPTLARRVGVALGEDARVRGVHFLLGPGVNIYRAPMNGRNFEYFGEDPCLGGQIVAGYIEGVQSERVVATVKHYDANNSEYDRHGINSIIDPRTLREIYLPIFEAAVRQGHVGAVMDSYNLLNGEHATQNAFLNIDVLRKDWGFRGILMSDWDATYDAVAAANAGLDLEMPSAKFMNAENLLPAIKAGKVSEATIDEKVRRILRVAIEFGWLDHDQSDLSLPLYNRRSLEMALDSAKESLVLLKNEGRLLPLDLSKVHTIALIGPDAYPAQASAGGSGHVTAIAPVSLLEGLTRSLPHTKILWNSGLKDLQELLGGRRSEGHASGNFSTDAQGEHPGLTQEEFDSGEFAGNPDRTRVVPGVRFWGGSPFLPRSNKKLAVRWTGYYTPKTSGPQEFIVASVARDSYQLYVDGKMVLDGLPGRGEPQSVEISLPSGQAVPVRLNYQPETNRIRVGFAALPAAEMLDPNATKVAAMADVVVLSVGFDPETEGEGHDRTYALPPGQEALIRAVAAVNHHTVVVLTSGGSVATSGWLDRVPAFFEAWYGGSEAGTALADALTGRTNPSGKLPITWWKRVEDNPTWNNYYEEPGTNDVHYREGVFLGYRAYGHNSQPAPLFPFGFGLSYTTFAFSNLSVSPRTASPDGPVTVSFDVKNTGSRAGSEVAEVYVSDPSAKVPRPKIELKGFERVTLKPGEIKYASIKLNQRSLAYWDVKSNGWKVDPGEFVVSVGDSSQNLPLKERFTVR
ncbi:MAG: glycosyl hydrolase [Acidobacteria bacterium]|nr:MAG: glycosyl hydrolase [Acidobacteriota bacterium]